MSNEKFTPGPFRHKDSRSEWRNVYADGEKNPIAPTDAVLEILEELDRAKKKHPDFPRSIVGMVSIMAEEAGEAIREANRIEDDKNGDLNALRTELIQTAAMCLRVIENMR